MRRVAGRAAFHAGCSVLEYKRTALFRVARSTCFRSGLLQLMEVVGAVRRMAIGALHRAFRHAVMRGKRKCGADVAVALVAELGLIFLQQTAREPAMFFGQRRHGKELRLRGLNAFSFWIVGGFHKVDRVAIEAGDAVPRVAGMIELRLLFAGLMALQAAFGICFWVALEGKNQFVGCRGFRVVTVSCLLRIRVGFTGAMAHFATDDRILMFREGGVSGLAKLNDFRFVARAAAIIAHIAGSGLSGYDFCGYGRRFAGGRTCLRREKSAAYSQSRENSNEFSRRPLDFGKSDHRFAAIRGIVI